MAWLKTSLVTSYFSHHHQHGIGKQSTYGQQMKTQGIQRLFHHSNKKITKRKDMTNKAWIELN